MRNKIKIARNHVSTKITWPYTLALLLVLGFSLSTILTGCTTPQALDPMRDIARATHDQCQRRALTAFLKEEADTVAQTLDHPVCRAAAASLSTFKNQRPHAQEELLAQHEFTHGNPE